MPSLPDHYRSMLDDLKLDYTVIVALLSSQPTVQLVERLIQSGNNSAARRTALWFASAVSEAADSDATTDTHHDRIPDEFFIELTEMVDNNEVNSTAAKEIFVTMQKDSDSPRTIAQKKNLLQVSDEGQISAIVDTVLADPASQKAIEDFRSGNEKAIGYLVGQIMKQSHGKANPGLAQKLIREKL